MTPGSSRRSVRMVTSAVVVLTLGVAIPGSAWGETIHDLFDRANERYWKGEYREAVDIYYEIMRLGIEDTDLWFNTGTAYAQMGEYGRAAYFYEKVLRVRPRDSAALANLEIVRSKVASERSKTRSGVDVHPSETLWSGILSWFAPNELALLFLLFYYAFFVALAIRHFLKNPVGRVAAAIFLAVFMVSWLVLGAMLLGKYRTHFLSHDGVVLESGIVMVHEGPDSQSPRVFDVIEAQRIEVLDTSGDWIRIRDDKGREGWLGTDQLGRL